MSGRALSTAPVDGRPASASARVRIAVFRALQLGDMLCAVPALRALRSACPEAHITLIGLPWARTFVERYSGLIDELLVFPGAVGFPEQPETDAGLPAFYGQARARRFDLALQLHGSGGPANDILFNLGARFCAGFVKPDERARAGCFIPWPDHLPEIDRYLALLRAMGMPADDRSLWLPLSSADHDEAEQLLEDFAIEPGRAIIVHAGAQLPSRRWPADRFAAVADALALDGYRILLTGTHGEAEVISWVRQRLSEPAIDLVGQTSLGGLAALVDRVALVVCNDTGISHVAAALRTPSVVIASGSDTRRWAPSDAVRHRVIADYPSCRPCSYRVCPVGHLCAVRVTPAQVLAAAREQLAARQPHRAGNRAGAVTAAGAIAGAMEELVVDDAQADDPGCADAAGEVIRTLTRQPVQVRTVGRA